MRLAEGCAHDKGKLIGLVESICQGVAPTTARPSYAEDLQL